MATKRNNSVNANNGVNNNETKVVCPQCGAEIAIGNHEHAVAGIAIGKDSGLGTVVLPLAGAGNGAPVQGVQVGVQVSGASVGANGAAGAAGVASKELEDVASILDKYAATNPDFAEVLRSIKDEIGDKYILVNSDKIVRRWVPAQFLRMLNAKNGKSALTDPSFHQAISGKGVRYSWNVLLRELEVQKKCLENKDFDDYNDRRRFWNKDLAIAMANGYKFQLEMHIESLMQHPRYCQREAYIKLPTTFCNYGKGLFLGKRKYSYSSSRKTNEVAMLKGHLATVVSEIENALGLDREIIAVKSFIQTMNKISVQKLKVDEMFVNVYKAAGAYYTAKDLIMFEGYLVKKAGNRYLDKEDSLDNLEDALGEIMRQHHGILNDGFKMLGYTRRLLADNGYNKDVLLNKWKRQSQLRKQQRAAAASRALRNGLRK